MLVITEVMEANVLRNIKRDFENAQDKDAVNKLYRQARVWTRFHLVYAEACSVSDRTELNKKLNDLRWKRLEELGYSRPVKK